MTRIFIRILIDLIIFVSILQGWWFVTVPLGIVGALFFSYFVELIIAGVMYDALFGLQSGQGIIGYLGTIVAIVLLGIVGSTKRLLR